MARASHRVERVPYLNPDAFSRFIGPKNWGQALINDELTTCLLDNGAQLNFITPAYAAEGYGHYVLRPVGSRDWRATSSHRWYGR